jgi:predicted  nucleic acid-binding Zn-ribbon protein
MDEKVLKQVKRVRANIGFAKTRIASMEKLVSDTPKDGKYADLIAYAQAAKAESEAELAKLREKLAKLQGA